MTEWMPEIRRRIAAARLDPARELEIAQELAQHLDDHYTELRRDGLPHEAARARALDGLKDHAALREQLAAVERRESTVVPAGAPARDRLIAGLWQDVRYALRTLRLNPGFAVLALTTIALGIAVTTVIYAVVDTVLLRPLPYRDADRIARVSQVSLDRPDQLISASYPNFADWRTASRTIEAMAIVNSGQMTLLDGDPEVVNTLTVTQDFLRLNGVRPLLGRDFASSDYEAGAPRVALITHAAWQRRFGGDPAITGRRLQSTAGPVEIVGVLPPDRLYWSAPDFVVPFRPPGSMGTARFAAAYPVYARLAPDTTLAQAQAEMDAIAASLAQAHPEDNENMGVRLTPITELATRTVRQPLFMVFGAVVCVLLIACVNVAGLQVARGAGRAQEIALRAALGASRWRIIRQLLTESIVLGLAGGALGVLLAWWLFAVLVPILPMFLPEDVAAIDARVVAIVLAASGLTGVLAGALPAFGTAAAGSSEGFKDSGRATLGWAARAGSGLVLVEIALALVLLTGAGLMVRTLSALYAVDPGFEPHAVVAWRVTPVITGVDPQTGAARRDVFYQSLLDGVGGLPGVASVALVDTPPFRGTTVNVMAKPEDDPTEVPIVPHTVTPGYFRTMGIPILQGRDFTDADGGGAARVVIVSARAAATMWPGRSPLGATLRMPYDKAGLEPHLVVGVAGDVRHRNLERDILAEVYQPLAQQRPYTAAAGEGHAIVVVARTDQPKALSGGLGALATRLPERVIAGSPQTFNELIAATTLQRRSRAVLFGVLAGLGLLLACVGIVGVTAHTVAQRTREIGIRMALGAQPRTVLSTVMGGLAVPVIGGLALGLLGAWGASRWVESFLFGVEPTDRVAFAAAALLLAAAAVVACYVPARRALRVDPMQALKNP